MREYQDRDQRLIFKTCPGCRADLEQETIECQFCDHQFQDELYESQLEPDARETLEHQSSSASGLVALNVILSLLSALLPAWDQLPHDERTDPPSYRMSDQDRQELMEYHKAVTERRHSNPTRFEMNFPAARKTGYEKLIIVEGSNRVEKRVQARSCKF